MKLEWEEIYEHPNCFKGRGDGFIYVVQSADPRERDRVQNEHDARIEAIALANGYVKLAPDEVVVKRATAETAFSWVMGFVVDGMTADDRDAQRDLEAVLNQEVKS